MRNCTNVIPSIFAVICLIFISCSDNSSGLDESESDAISGEGELNVAGDIDSQHEGLSQYIGLESNGGWVNLTLNIADYPIGSEEVNDFSFDIRMTGDGGPFQLATGEYSIGENPEGPTVIANYANRVITNRTVTYGTSPNSSGTVTIISVNSTSVEAVFDVILYQDVTTDEGAVTITGELKAECHSTPAGGC